MNQIIFKICYSLILALIFIVPIINLKLIKESKKSLIFYYLSTFILTYLSHNAIINPIIFPLVLLGTLCYIYYYYRKILSTLLVTNIVNIIIILSLNISLFSVSYMFKVHPNETLESNELLIISLIITFILCYFFSKILYIIFYKLKSRYEYILSKNYFKSYYILTTITLLVVIIFLTYLLVIKLSIEISYTLAVIVIGLLSIYLLITLLALIYSFIEYWLDKKYTDTEYSTLKKYVSEIEESSYELRRFKHDYMNILSTLGDYINNKDMDGLSNFFNNDLLPESQKAINNDKRLYLLSHINIPPIKSLVSNKIVQAINSGINVKVEVSDDINSIPVDTLDLCRILGVFLDNAIEAVSVCTDKIIHFAAITTDTQIIFVINNSCTQDTPPIYKLYEEGFSTKGKCRGLGLSSIKKLIDDKYPNILLNTNMRNCIFTQELRITL